MSQAEELEALGLDPAETPELTPDERERWLGALRAALSPSDLPRSEHERLIEMALEDPLAPASEEELIESARLREALDADQAHEDAALLAALRAPFAEQGDAAAAIERAIAPLTPAEKPRRNVIYVIFGAGSVALAAAAGLLLTLGTLSQRSASEAAAPVAALARPRSTMPLFASHFTGNATARVDLIASARTRELRDNRYAAWGVR